MSVLGVEGGDYGDLALEMRPRLRQRNEEYGLDFVAFLVMTDDLVLRRCSRRARLHG